MCLYKTPLFLDLLSWQGITWLLCYSHCSTPYTCYLPNQPFSLAILDSFFISISNTGTLLPLSWQPVCLNVPVFYVHVNSLEQFSQYSKHLVSGKTLTSCLYLWLCMDDHAVLTHLLFEALPIVFLDLWLPRPTGMTLEQNSSVLTLIKV